MIAVSYGVSSRFSDQRPNSLTYNFVEISGHIFRVLRFEVSVYNVYITNKVQITFSPGGRGSKVR
jgi:hypothetical protein